VIAIALFTLVAGYVLFAIAGAIGANRVAVDAEREGLDVAELGASAYPDFGSGAPHDSRR
jgi:ammonia channel protein AmtB